MQNIITIRPIFPDDAVIEDDFVKNLSSETKHNRFFCALKKLSPKQLEQLCNVDGFWNMAFIATINDQEGEHEIGVARYVKTDEDDLREMAITIADDWKDVGLQRKLADVLINYAKHKNVNRLYSVELASNMEMKNLAKELAMTVDVDPDDYRQVIYRLNIGSH